MNEKQRETSKNKKSENICKTVKMGYTQMVSKAEIKHHQLRRATDEADKNVSRR